MIINFNTYINEMFRKKINLNEYVDNFFKEIGYDNIVLMNHKTNTNKYLCDRKLLFKWKMSSFASLKELKKDEYVLMDFNFKKSYFLKKDNLKDFFKKHFESYYRNLLDIKDKQFKLIEVPILDIDKYNDFILNLLKANQEYIKEKNVFLKFLTDKYKEKIEHLLNASNFDII